MASIEIKAGGGGAPLPDGNLQIKNGLPIDATLQTVSDQAGNDSALNISTASVGIGTTTATGLLNLYKAAAAVRLMINGDAGQNRLITYRTGGLQRFGLYVNNDAETGSNVGSNFQIRRYNDTGTLGGTPLSINRATGEVTIPEKLTLSGSELKNFTPTILTDSINFTINSANQDTYCGAILEVIGALTITFDGSIRLGFNISVIQKTANSTTFATTGTLNLRNRQGHTKTFGQYSTVTLVKTLGNDLILAGDTAP